MTGMLLSEKWWHLILLKLDIGNIISVIVEQEYLKQKSPTIVLFFVDTKR
jgi:hypothetical protein